MTGRLMECITNPVKCKLLLEIHSKGKATAKQLADIYTDIPQATLYRHLKKMAGHRRQNPMSGTYSVFPLQIVVVSYSVRTTNPVVFVTVSGGVQFEHHQQP